MKILSNLDLAKNQIINALLQVLGSDPTGTEAQVYYNSTSKTPKVHNGSAWVSVLLSNLLGIANGVATLDGSGKIPAAQLPDSILGQLEYQGAFNASSGVAPVAPAKGFYWVVSAAGTINTVAYAIGDWIVYNGTSFDKIDNTDSVVTVAGRTGAVVLSTSDISDYAEYVHPTADGNKHVPANGTSNNGKFLQATGTAGEYQWAAPTGGGTVNKYVAAVGNGSLTSIAVTHNLGTRDVTVNVYEASSPYAIVLADCEMTDVNTIMLKFAVAPTSGQYRVVVVG